MDRAISTPGLIRIGMTAVALLCTVLWMRRAFPRHHADLFHIRVDQQLIRGHLSRSHSMGGVAFPSRVRARFGCSAPEPNRRQTM